MLDRTRPALSAAAQTRLPASALAPVPCCGCAIGPRTLLRPKLSRVGDWSHAVGWCNLRALSVIPRACQRWPCLNCCTHRASPCTTTRLHPCICHTLLPHSEGSSRKCLLPLALAVISIQTTVVACTKHANPLQRKKNNALDSHV